MIFTPHPVNCKTLLLQYLDKTFAHTVDSRFNESRGKMENSSLYREFAISKNFKIVFFGQILNFRLDLYLQLNEGGEDDKNYVLSRMKT